MSGIKITGIDNVMARLRNMELNLNQALEFAVKKSMIVVKDKARLILEESQTHNWPDKDGNFHEMSDGDLWKSFRSEVIRIGKDVVAGRLNNRDVAAPWMEFGTKEHQVSPIHADVLAFYVSQQTVAYSRGHTVHGIEATHFMSRALEESYPVVVDIFKDVMKTAGFSGNPGAVVALLSDLSDDDNPGFTLSGE